MIPKHKIESTTQENAIELFKNIIYDSKSSIQFSDYEISLDRSYLPLHMSLYLEKKKI